MKIQDVMSKDVKTVRGNTTVREAARMMAEEEVGALPVTDEQRLLGMLTDRDIVTRFVAEGNDPDVSTVSDVMSPRVLYCFSDQECEEVARNMVEQEVLRLVVVDRQKRLVGIVGIVSAGDLQSRASVTRANDGKS